MKILAIHIKNLASLEGENTIDFNAEPLSSAGIFAITGSTGAGKSTILDALCLALYAKTPRYKLAEGSIVITDATGSSMSQDDARGILRDGAGEGFAKVDFVGMDGKPYQAVWIIRRARSKAEGKLQQYDMQLSHLRSRQPIPGKKGEILKEIERLVGLNFEQFTRSVLLAQGDFTAFLKAGKDEKSSLLEKLTGMQIYSEISKQVFQNCKEQEQVLRDLNTRTNGIRSLSSEELDELKKTGIALKEQEKIKEEEVAKLNKAILWRKRLSELALSLDDIKAMYEIARVEQENTEERQKKLKEVLSVQPVKPVFQKMKETEGLILMKQSELQDAKNQFLKTEEERKAATGLLSEAYAKIQAIEKGFEETLPLLNKAKELDVLLREKEAYLKTLISQQQIGKQEVQEMAKQLGKAQLTFEALKKQQIKLVEWQRKNENRGSIAEQEKLILEKLKDATQYLLQIQGRNHTIKELKNAQEQNDLLTAKASAEEVVWQEKKKATQSTLKGLEEQLWRTDIKKTEEKLLPLENNTASLTTAKAHWKIFYDLLLQNRKKENQLKKSIEYLEDVSKKLKEIQRVLPTLKTKKEVSENMLRKAQLAAAENVEVLRGSLVIGEPCPVCGSIEHPYDKGNIQLHRVLMELEKENEFNENQLLDFEKKENEISRDSSFAIREIKVLKTDISDLQNQIAAAEKEWKTFDVYELCSQMEETKISEWLEEKLVECRSELQGVRIQIKDFSTLKATIETEKNDLAQIEKQISQIENTGKDILRKQQSTIEKLGQSIQDKLLFEENLLGIRKEVSVYLIADKWYEQWQLEPQQFIEKIKLFAEQWRDSNSQLGELEQQAKNMEINLRGDRERYAVQEQQIRRLSLEMDSYQKQFYGLQENRKDYFKGQPVETVEANFSNSLKDSRMEWAAMQKSKDACEAAFTRIQTLKSNTEKELTVLSNKEIDCRTQIGTWLSKFNKLHHTTWSVEELESLLVLGQEWIDAERVALQEIKEKVLQVESVKKEREDAFRKLENEKVTQLEPVQLQELFQEIKSRQEAIKSQIHHLAFRLDQDEANKQQLSGLFEEITQQTEIFENWSKLNDVIGSADGKKFRQIAQEYTLETLLSFANVHLKVLSQRYVLQRIPDSLGLQVMDLDMGREVRTVFSLSGGESFLVSLALALGLASLSSNKMKVESLFIDEGFGSLDPDTLNIAMDALERLHNQGRKVGVISHVQEMTERIPVQIKVHKRQSGRSKLEVVGS